MILGIIIIILTVELGIFFLSEFDWEIFFVFNLFVLCSALFLGGIALGIYLIIKSQN